MNQIRRSPLPALSGKVPFSPLLAVFLLAATSVQNATEAAQPRRIALLESHKAVKLLIHLEKPDYPPIAKVNYIQGAVNLEIKVNS